GPGVTNLGKPRSEPDGSLGKPRSEPDGSLGKPRSAGIVSRSVAAVIDLLFVAVVLGALYVGLILTRLMFNPSSFSFPTLNAVFSTAVMFGVAVFYLTACWAVSGCTVGAVAMGLRVTGRRGGRLPPVIALIRAATCVLFPVGLLWVAVDVRRRSLPDVVLGSRVVYARP
ncbi:MAG: RDD family protein, partial [Mycobacterium sp.]